MMRPGGICAGLLALCLGGCVGRTTGNDGDSDGSGSGGSATDTSDSDTSSTSGGGSGDTTGGATGGVCAGLDDQDVELDIPVLLRNGTDDPVYLRALDFCTSNLYRIESQNDAQPGHWPPGDCEPTCEAMRTGGCACPEGCFEPLLIRLEPAGIYRETWPGVILEPDDQPAACLEEDWCPSGPCPVRREAIPGSYEATAGFMLWPTACDPNTGDPTLCECTPNADGWCETQAYAEGEEFDSGTVFVHPDTAEIDIAFLKFP